MKKINKKQLLFVLFLFLFFITGCTNDEKPVKEPIEKEISQKEEIDLNHESDTDNKITHSTIQTDTNVFKVHFLDVGQADACLLEYNGHFMMIDAGDNKDEGLVVDILNNMGVKKLEVLVGTHPHADHIGGMDAVIEQFEIGEIYMPKVMATTQTFEDVLNAIEKKGLFVHAPSPGDTILFETIPVQVLAPVKEYNDMNNNSIMLKVLYHNTGFVFTGDGEIKSETDVLNKGYDLKADVIKIGHHGSETSTGQTFLDAVNPQYAVISLGTDNKYGHPSQSVLERLQKQNITVFRTDENGTITAITDGNTIQFETEKTQKEKTPDTMPKTQDTLDTVSNNQVSYEQIYIGNKNTHKFHLSDCRSLPSDKNRISFDKREIAIENGYVPCKICNP